MLIEIDGSLGEGGGQILRTALALSTLTGRPFKAHNIRAGRKKPGLKAQHLHGVRALCSLSLNPDTETSTAEAKEAKLGSLNLSFSPGRVYGRTLSIDMETAGSATLLLQCLLIPCLFADKKVRLKIRGGSDVAWSPSFDYFYRLILPQYRAFAEIKVELLRRGFYPKGGGKLEVVIKPHFSLSEFSGFKELQKEIRSQIPPLNLSKQKKITAIQGSSIASNTLREREVAERQIRGARQALSSLNLPVKIKAEYADSKSIGTCITLWAAGDADSLENPPTLGASALGEKQIRAEDVGRQAAVDLLKEIDSACAVDRHLADNLIPLLALRGGKLSAASVSAHATTNIEIVSRFLGSEFSVQGSQIICK